MAQPDNVNDVIGAVQLWANFVRNPIETTPDKVNTAAAKILGCQEDTPIKNLNVTNFKYLQLQIQANDLSGRLAEQIAIISTAIGGEEPVTEVKREEAFVNREQVVEKMDDPMREVKAALLGSDRFSDLEHKHSLLLAKAPPWASFLTNKVFAAIHGSHLIRGTALEGGSPRESLMLCQELFKSMRQEGCRLLPESVISHLDSMSKKEFPVARELSAKIEGCKNSNDVMKVIDDIQNKIDGLAIGERILVPGGWSKYLNDEGHAMMFEVRRDGDDEYSFTIYNSGAGIEHHERFLRQGVEEHDRYQLFTKFTGAPRSAVCSESLWQVLVENRALSTEFKGEAETIYHAVSGVMSQYPIVKMAVMADDDPTPMKAQIAGTCFWKWVHPLLRNDLGFDAYKAFKFELKLQTLIAYYAEHKEIIIASETERRLILEGIRGLSRGLLKRWNMDAPVGRMLPADFALKVAVTLGQMEREIHEILAAGTVKQMDIGAIKNETEEAIEDILPYMSLQQFVHQIPLKTVNIEPAKTRPEQGPAINKKDLIASLKKCREHLNLLMNSEESRDPYTVNAYLEDIMNQLLELGIPSQNFSFHHSVLKEEECLSLQEELMEWMNSTMKLYDLQSFQAHGQNDKKLTVDDIRVGWQLWTAIDQIGRRLRAETAIPETPFNIDCLMFSRDPQGRIALDLAKKQILECKKISSPILCDYFQFDKIMYGLVHDETEVLMTKEGKGRYLEEIDQLYQLDAEEVARFNSKEGKKVKGLTKEAIAKALRIEEYGQNNYYPRHIALMKQATKQLGSMLDRTTYHSEKEVLGPYDGNEVIHGVRGKTYMFINRDGYRVIAPHDRYEMVGFQSENVIQPGAWLEGKKRIEKRVSIELGKEVIRDVEVNIGALMKQMRDLLKANLKSEEAVLLRQQKMLPEEMGKDAELFSLLMTYAGGKMRIAETLHYFSRHPELLEKVEWRLALEQLFLMENLHLESTLNEEPALLNTLYKFCDQILTHFMDRQQEVQLEAVLHIIRLESNLRIVAGIPQKDCTKLLKYLYDTAKAEMRGLSEGDIGAIAFTRQIFLLNQSDLTDEQWLQVVSDSVDVCLNDGGEAEGDPSLRDFIGRKIARNRERIVAVLASTNGKITLDTLVSKCIPDLQLKGDKRWQGEFPILCRGVDLSFNILTGEFQSSSGFTSLVPKAWVNDKQWKALFGNERLRGMKNGYVYFVDHPKYGKLGFKNEKNILTIAKLMPGGKWYSKLTGQYIFECFDKGARDKMVAIGNTINGLHLAENQDIWVCIEPGSMFFEKKDPISNISNTQMMVFDWKEMRPTMMFRIRPEICEKYKVTEFNELPWAKYFTSGRLRGYHRSIPVLAGAGEIVRLDDLGEPSEVMAKPTQKAGEWIHLFAAYNTKRIVVWNDPQTHEPKAIELQGVLSPGSDKPLRLEIQNKKLIWAANPDYWLVPGVGLAGGLRGCLVVENNRGVKRILVPVCPLTRGSGPLQVDNLQFDAGIQSKVLRYVDVELREDGRILSDDPIALEQLAYLHLARRDFIAAQNALEEMDNLPFFPLNERGEPLYQKDKLKWNNLMSNLSPIIQEIMSIDDKSLYSAAIQLRAADLYLQMGGKLDLSVERLQKKLIDLLKDCYQRYILNAKQGMAGVELNVQSECRLLTEMIKLSENDIKYLAILTSRLDRLKKVMPFESKGFNRIKTSMEFNCLTNLEPSLKEIEIAIEKLRDFVSKHKTWDGWNHEQGYDEGQYRLPSEKTKWFQTHYLEYALKLCDIKGREEVGNAIFSANGQANEIEQGFKLLLLYFLHVAKSNRVWNWKREDFIKNIKEHVRLAREFFIVSSGIGSKKISPDALVLLKSKPGVASYRLRGRGLSREFALRGDNISFSSGEMTPLEERTSGTILQRLELAKKAIEVHRVDNLTPPKFDVKASEAKEQKPIKVDCGNDPVIKRELSEANEDLIEGVRINANKKRSTAVYDLDTFINEINNGPPSIHDRSRSVQSLRRQILNVVNTEPVDPNKKIEYALGVRAKKVRELTMSDCYRLYLQGEATMQDCSEMNEKQRQLFLHLMTECLLANTELQHRTRVLREAIKVNELKTECVPEEREAAITKLMELVGQERPYSTDINNRAYRVMLVFEDQADIRLRVKQVDMIKTLLSKNETGNYQDTIMQLIMGGGKSKVILPIIAMARGSEERLSVVLAPESLKDVLSGDLWQSAHKLFAQQVKTIEFSRGMTLQDLQVKYDLLQRLIKERSVLVTTAHDLQCLELAYYEFLDKTNNPLNAEQVKEINLYQKLLEIFADKADVIIDEVDTVADVRREVHFTFGTMGRVPKELIGISLRMYQALNSIIDLTRLPEDGISVEQFRSTLCSTLLIKIIEDRCFNDLTLSQKDQLLAYFNEKTELPEFVKEMKAKGDLRAEIIPLIGYQLRELLELTLTRVADINYGFSGNSQQRAYAIPYKGKDQPNELADFASEFETMNLTIQLYLQKGILDHQAKKILEEWQVKTGEEMKEGGFKSIDDTPSGKKFVERFGIGIFELNVEKPKDIATILRVYRENPELIFEFLETRVLDQIHRFPVQVSSYSATLFGMLSSVQGITGTPWNRGAMHQRMIANLDKGTDGRIIDKLLKEDAPVNVIQVATTEAILKYANPQTRAIIDVAAFFRDRPNVEIAQEILNVYKSRPEKVRAVLFFEGGTLSAVTDKRGVIRFSGSDISKLYEMGYNSDSIFTFYDQSHTTGTDIPQMLRANALTTVNEKVFVRDVLQGVFRMRGLLDYQSIGWVTTEKGAERLKALAAAKAEDKLDVRSILGATLIKQAQRVGEDNLRGLKSNLNNLIRQQVREQLVKGDAEFVVNRFHNEVVGNLLIEKVQSSPFHLFGDLPKEVEIFKYLRETLIPELIKTAVDLELNSADLKAKMTSLIKQAEETQKLTSVIRTQQDARNDAAVEREMTTEEEQQAEVEAQVEESRHAYPQSMRPYANQNKWKENIYLFKPYKNTSIQDVLTKYYSFSLKKEIPSIYGSNLMISDAQCSVTDSGNLEILSPPFKPVQRMLIWRNEKKECFLLIVDQWDANEIRERLLKDEIKEENGNQPIGLIDIEGNPIQLGKETKPEDFEDPEIQKLMMQARHFAGDMIALERPDRRESFLNWMKERETEAKLDHLELVVRNNPDQKACFMRFFNRNFKKE
jgi:hypothetical protein